MKKFIKYVLAMLTMVAMAVCVAGCSKDKDEKDGNEGGASGSADIKYAWKLTKRHIHMMCDHNITLNNMGDFEWEDMGKVDGDGIKAHNYIVITTDGKFYEIKCVEYEGTSCNVKCTVYENYSESKEGIEVSGKHWNYEYDFDDKNMFSADDIKNIAFALSQPMSGYDGTESDLYEGLNLSDKKVLIFEEGDGYSAYGLWERIK